MTTTISNTTDTDPPDASLGVSCPRCGSGDMRPTARRLGKGWADYLCCGSCREAVGPLPRKPKCKTKGEIVNTDIVSIDNPPTPPLPAGELSARAGLLDQLTREAADGLDRVCDRAAGLQRLLLERACGRTPPLSPTALRAITAIVREVEGRLGDALTVISSRVAVEAPPPEPSLFGAFVGWFRQGRGQKWKAIVHGQTEEETLDKLLDHAGPGDRCVLPAGRDPNKGGRPR
jgi:hypothetical protein